MPLAGATQGPRSRALERLFEVTSVLPLAGFALLHLATYGRTLFGATEVGKWHAPSALALAGEVVGIWLPLGFHAAYAVPVWLRRRAGAVPGATDRAWLALHRLTGGVLGLFLLDHFLRFRLPILRGDRYPAESVLALTRELSSTAFGFPLLAGAHALGVLALSFHLGYGLMRVADRRLAPPARGRVRALAAGIGLLSAVLGTLTLVRLATG